MSVPVLLSAQIVVVGTGDPDIDIAAVQSAAELTAIQRRRNPLRRGSPTPSCGTAAAYPLWIWHLCCLSGIMKLKMEPEWAPENVRNFLKLIATG